jgi:NAD(P)-dependent dehydrogenase (short-subunit alcohol dehydrogenase family)
MGPRHGRQPELGFRHDPELRVSHEEAARGPYHYHNLYRIIPKPAGSACPTCRRKPALPNLVRQAALELARYNITVNAIAPGAFATNIGGGRLKSENVSRAMSKRIPLGRVADPDEVKGLALFLASSASSFVKADRFRDGR